MSFTKFRCTNLKRFNKNLRKFYIHKIQCGKIKLLPLKISLFNLKIVCRKEDCMFFLFISVFQFEDPLLREKWYFGEIDRVVGSEKLKKFNQVDNIFRSLFNITLYNFFFLLL
jgi:hypothetical protein